MYRNQRYIDIAGKRSLLEIALDVHSTTTGGYDRSAECQIEDVEALRIALNTWTESGIEKFANFDYHVKQLVQIALEEYDKYGPDWMKPKIKKVRTCPLDESFLDVSDEIIQDNNLVDDPNINIVYKKVE